MAGMIALVVALGATISWVAYDAIRRSVDGQVDGWAAAVARGVAVAGGDRQETGRLLAAVRSSNDAVRYVLVLDGRGRVVAASGAVPAAAPRAYDLSSSEMRVVRVTTPQGTVRDVATGRPGQAGGAVHVGVAEALAGSMITGALRRISAMTVVVLAIGMIAAYVLTRNLTDPLRRLLVLTREFASGNLSRRAGLVCQDEIGALGAAFDQMAERLQALVGELRQKEEARRRLLTKVISAQEEERKRVARELHDEIGQCFTSLAVGLRALEHLEDPRAMRQCAAELRALASASVETVKDLSRGLRPSVLDDLGLGAALERFVQQVGVKFGLDIDLVVRGLERRLPPEVETALYRIIQEALTNVGRHARARRADVVVERRGELVRAVVRDDGLGFDPGRMLGATGATADCCLGLVGMQERARILGGDVTIQSEPGQGTAVTVRIPLPADDEGETIAEDQVALGG